MIQGTPPGAASCAGVFNRLHKSIHGYFSKSYVKFLKMIFQL